MSLAGVNFLRTASVLGYCLLPLVLTSAIGVILSLEYPVPCVRSADFAVDSLDIVLLLVSLGIAFLSGY